MAVDCPSAIYLKDYHAPAFNIPRIHLEIELNDGAARIRSYMTVARVKSASVDVPLVLDGESLVLRSVAVNGVHLGNSDYRADSTSLTIQHVPDEFTLEIETEISPSQNTELSGLYQTNGNYCTQCEAEGFRRITYFLDRPDILSRYSTKIIAEKARCPVLLSNGNLVEEGSLPDGRHWALWEDPFPKPSYLFALVAGDLTYIHDRFVTSSGRSIDLYIYVQKHNIDQCDHAMVSLKKAMKWDEDVYGREYDLDRYMIVAVDDFNMGAMENKGLNIFNSKYVLAKPRTATDQDYQNIEGVIGHEYFHNWSGNRVTCRDWFQLSLKEGFTVFRDQEFTADMQSRGVKRITDANLLRTHQFREDASPMAHPVRPDSYVEINNFYTVTIYEKGAEVIRMLWHILGAELFRKGTDIYFDRHDGQAVTTEDFVKAMEDASGMDLAQFRLWYTQAGTPVLDIETSYDQRDQCYIINVKQSCPSTPGQDRKVPMHIPLALGLLDEQGNDLPLHLMGEEAPTQGTRTVHVKNAEQTFRFQNVSNKPVPSLLRGFSAPVKVNIDYLDEELRFLMEHDTDDFNRWEAGQRFAVRTIMDIINQMRGGRPNNAVQEYVQVFAKVLSQGVSDKAFHAQMLTLPSEAYLSEFMEVIDPTAIHEARRVVRQEIAKGMQGELLALYHDLSRPGPFRIDADAMGERSLKNTCLGYLMELNDDKMKDICLDQYRRADNMTDALAALTFLVNCDWTVAEPVLEGFHAKWSEESLVVDKWFSLQAASRCPGGLDRVKKLIHHPAFNIANPNKVRALIGTFCQANLAQFHEASGAGYRFLADKILQLNDLNPQVAARLVNPFILWRRYDTARQDLMKGELMRIFDSEGISKDVYEVVSKSLE